MVIISGNNSDLINFFLQKQKDRIIKNRKKITTIFLSKKHLCDVSIK